MAQEIDNLEETDQPDIRALRKAAEAGKKAQDELAQMKRELMFAKAGIDTGSKIGALLFKTWEGDDVDALKSEATDLGILGAPAPVEAEVPAEEKSQQEFRQSFNRGAPAAAAELPEQDPYDEAHQLFADARQRGVPMDDAGLAAIDRILVAASSGDKRAIFNTNDWVAERNQIGHRFDR